MNGGLTWTRTKALGARGMPQRGGPAQMPIGKARTSGPYAYTGLELASDKPYSTHIGV